MTTEATANRFATTLSGGVNNSTTTIPLTSVTGAPTGGNWRLLVDDEIMLVTSVASLNATVQRGVEGTTAASHSSGAAATAVLSAAGLLAVVRQGVVPNVRQSKLNGTGAITGVTLSDTPLEGNTLILAVDGFNSGNISSVACTNVTWTFIDRIVDGGGAHIELYVGHVGASPGTAITFTNPNSFSTALCIEVDATVSSTPVAGSAAHGEMNGDTVEIAAVTAGHLVVAVCALDNTTLGNWCDVDMNLPHAGINNERVSVIAGYANGGRVYAGAHGSPAAGGVVLGEIS